MRRPRAGIVLTLAALVGCRSADPAAPPRMPELEAGALLTAEDGWPAGWLDSAGFDPLVGMEAPAAIQEGDLVLYRLTAHDEDGERAWLVRSQLGGSMGTATFRGTSTDPEGREHEFVRKSPAYHSSVLLQERGAEELIVSGFGLPRLSMEQNLFTSAAASAQAVAAGEADDELREAIFVGMGAALTLFNGWQENETLEGILNEVVSAPSAFGVVRSFFSADLALHLTFDLNHARPAVARLPEPLGELPGYRVPFSISFGSELLLNGEIHTVAPAAPLSVGLGVVEVIGAHPDEPERWVRAELIGARRAK